MATAARLLPSIKPQMALQTLPQFIFQGALRDHHLENNTSGKTKGRTEGFKITAKCSLLTIGSKHVMGWEGSTYPRWTSLSEPWEVFLSTLYPLEIFTVRPSRRSLSFLPAPHANVRKPDSDLQQLSKSEMTDEFIFSSWVYIPGMCTADLALTSARSLQAVF